MMTIHMSRKIRNRMFEKGVLSMVIAHNIAAMTALRYNKLINSRLQKVMRQLSSGYRINCAADDAAGLAISERMRAQISGLNTASQNAQDGISLIQTAEGAMDEVHSMLQRMRELANKAANGTYTTAERENMNFEVQELKAAINGISSSTNYNTMNLLDGSTNTIGSNDASSIKLQVGANAGQTMNMQIDNISTDKIGISNLDISTQSGASSALSVIDNAINKVSTSRGRLGAYQNRLEHTISNLENQAENLQEAESRIRDTDMAKSMMEYVQLSIMAQANQLMIAQALKQPNMVLTLLQSL